MAVVLHHVHRWLDLSAGFVAATLAHSRHRAVVTSLERPQNRAAFPHRPVVDLSRLLAVPGGTGLRAPALAIGGVALLSRARLLHVHFGYALPQAAGAARRLGLPLVVSLHGHDVTALTSSQPGHYCRVVGLPAAVIVPSAWLAARAVDVGFPADRVHVIGSGVDTRAWRPSALPDEPRVGFVGRLVEKKGLDVLLAAWPRVRADVPAAQLHVLGDGPLRTLMAHAPEGVHHELPDARDPGGQARRLVARSRVVVTPSRRASDGDSESLLLVNLEAQASGRPLVTSAHGGIPEYVEDGASALVVPEGDPDSLASAIVRVLRDRSLAEGLSAHGPRVAAAHDVRLSAARLDRIYDRLLASGRS